MDVLAAEIMDLVDGTVVGIAGTPETAALPALLAATSPDAGGRFFGPGGLGETRGRVTDARLSREAADPAVGARLWAKAEELTGVSYP